MCHQQNISRRTFGVVILLSNNWPQVRERVTDIQNALGVCLRNNVLNYNRL